ncbi:MAG: hypothetical protein Q8M01_10765 [Rubrivivax sp.]|nr:hypothetical protein [Rubrivivax sp.]
MRSNSSQGAKHLAREVSAGYGELALVEMPAIDLLTSLGWSFKNLYAETFGELGSEGRESESQPDFVKISPSFGPCPLQPLVCIGFRWRGEM